eukprot:CAMPEP_0202894398 /NCGR_PEP_ID=MMETSP1392-20130828/3819_1 /ASSEMBLY_ACC=CAM_ASM_000868 /TAXON_ID=225041 /ORGANISM="Chlamydomonas chlamydogama, Strain SAG 11-48b" /LENGTH=97 /DNA_ID=CAMNT_0049579089 /DNA_START=257 /DNA_END=550 /DNA_ORIENTATION=-
MATWYGYMDGVAFNDLWAPLVQGGQQRLQFVGVWCRRGMLGMRGEPAVSTEQFIMWELMSGVWGESVVDGLVTLGPPAGWLIYACHADAGNLPVARQ